MSSYKQTPRPRSLGIFDRRIRPPPPLPSDASDHASSNLEEFDLHCRRCIEAYSGRDKQAFVFSLAFLSRHCRDSISAAFVRVLCEREVPELLLQVLREITPTDIATALQTIPLHLECLRLVRILARGRSDFCSVFLELGILPIIVNSIRAMSFSLQTQALAILAILVYNEENAALADSAASLLTLGIEFSTVSDCMVRLTAMELLLELSERIDLLPVTSRLTLLSIFTSVILDGGNRDVWRPALDGIAALLNSEFTRLEKQMPTIEKAILMGLHSGNEMVILSALRCFPCLYEFASVKDIHAFHENIDYVLLCSVLRSNDIEAQKCVLNAFGQMVKRGFEDWFEAMVNYSIFHRIMEFTLTSVFEIKVGIAKIFGCALGMASEALTAHLLDIGALQLMVDVLDPGMTIDDRLQIEFFGIFESLFERFPRLIPTLQEALLTRENLEFMLGLEPQDEMTAAAYQRFMHVIQPQEGSA